MSDQADHRSPAVLSVAMTIASSLVIATAALRWPSLATLFVAPDVALVYVIGVIPLAFAGARHLRRSPANVAVLLLLASGLALIWAGVAEIASQYSSTLVTNMLRTIIAFSIVVSTAVVSSETLTRIGGFTTGRRSTDCHPAVLLSFGLLTMALLPTTYVEARCQHDIAEFIGLIEQSRLGEARALIQTLIHLSPSAKIHGQTLQKLATEVDREHRKLESQIAAIPPNADSPEQRLQRCRILAMLGRSDDALAELISLHDSSVSPGADDLCGTICETTADWATAQSFHSQARVAWRDRPESPERTAGIFRATTRIAYCHRKLGNYDLAEAEYCDALAQSPTAQTHFLLAQFYEDMQQSTKARNHARHAMQLAPQHYQHEGRKLIDKLAVGHFGCLAIHFAESPATGR